MRHHKDPSRRQPKPSRRKTPKQKTTQAEDNPSGRQLKHRRPPQPRQPPQPPQARGHCTRYVAVHPLRGGAPVTWHCTRYVAVHPLRGGAPEQKRCIAYSSGAAPQHTRTNAELAHRTTHRRTPPCAAGPYWRQDGHAAHATTCTPAHSDTSYTLTCEAPDYLSAYNHPQARSLAEIKCRNAPTGAPTNPALDVPQTSSPQLDEPQINEIAAADPMGDSCGASGPEPAPNDASAQPGPEEAPTQPTA